MTIDKLSLIFQYNGHQVRTAGTSEAPWFVAQDVCDILELPNISQACSRLDDDEKNTITINDGIPGNPEHLCLSESGLYSLVLTSRKPEAKAFKKWITSEVLPSIRKTGSYNLSNVQPDPQPQAPTTPIEALLVAVQHMAEMENKLKEHTEQLAELKSQVEEQAIVVNPKTCRATINQMVRSYAYVTGYKHGQVWDSVYREMNYRLSIRLPKEKQLDYLQKGGLLPQALVICKELLAPDGNGRRRTDFMTKAHLWGEGSEVIGVVTTRVSNRSNSNDT